jgi:hypothetical protein
MVCGILMTILMRRWIKLMRNALVLVWVNTLVGSKGAFKSPLETILVLAAFTMAEAHAGFVMGVPVASMIHKYKLRVLGAWELIGLPLAAALLLLVVGSYLNHFLLFTLLFEIESRAR